MKDLIYVELDCLLDTRIVTLANMVSGTDSASLLTDKYFERKVDDFTSLCGISKQAFAEAYKKRTKEVLYHARPTEMVAALHELILTIEKEAIYTPYTGGADLQVNTYPYQLDKVELDAIEDAVSAYSGVDCRVEATYFPPEDLTPALIKNGYAAILLYDFNGWLELHHESLLEAKMPRVTFIAPALYLTHEPGEGEVELPDRDVRSAFAATELALVDTIDLRLQDARKFSIFTP